MRRFVLLMLLSAPVARAPGQETLNTGVPLDIGSRVFFGQGAEMNLAWYIGQTFVIPEGLTTLSGFQFGALPGPVQATSNFSYRGELQAWDPLTNTATGPVLFSAGRTRLDPTTLEFRVPSFETGGITVTPGQAYVAFLRAVGFAPPDMCLNPPEPIINCLSLMSIIGGSTNPYAEGHVVVPWPNQMLLAPPPLLNQVDVALTVSFAPEPGSWLLTATALGAIAAFVRRRRTRTLGTSS